MGKYTSSVKKYFESYEILDKKGKGKLKLLHANEIENVLEKNMNFRKKNSLAMVINGGAVEFVSVITFILVAILLFEGKISVGMATIAFTYSTKFMDPIFELNINIGRINSVKGIKDKLCQMMQKVQSVETIDVEKLTQIDILPIKKGYGKTNIEIQQMFFSFPQKYLITGDNGAGKSVLLRLMMQFEKPDSGSIEYNKLKNVDTSNHFSYIPQQPIIFDTTYINNVTIFDAYDSKNLKVYESFFPEELIRKVQNNKDPKGLSGGEKQVIAILRALCSEKEILLLDEPFSAMNQATIDCFMKNIDKIDRMLIIVAHNLDEHKKLFNGVYHVGRNKKEF